MPLASCLVVLPIWCIVSFVRHTGPCSESGDRAGPARPHLATCRAVLRVARLAWLGWTCIPVKGTGRGALSRNFGHQEVVGVMMQPRKLGSLRFQYTCVSEVQLEITYVDDNIGLEKTNVGIWVCLDPSNK